MGIEGEEGRGIKERAVGRERERGHIPQWEGKGNNKACGEGQR